MLETKPKPTHLEEELPKPQNGPCDRVAFCKYASAKCRQPLADVEVDKPGYWRIYEKWHHGEFQYHQLPAAPNRRWIDCAGWKLTLGMVFDKESGSWVYPIKPEHFGLTEVKNFGGVSIVEKEERCPNCETKLRPGQNLEYLGITWCRYCEVYWNREKTKKTTEWKHGQPYFGE